MQNREDDYTTAHPLPAETLLVMEVADSSLEYDRTVKLSLYAKVQVRDYWLFNVLAHYLENYSEPFQKASGEFSYLNRRIVTPTGKIALSAFPETVLQLAPVFPKTNFPETSFPETSFPDIPSG